MDQKFQQNIANEQSENKKYPDNLVQIQNPLRALAYWLYGKRLLATTF